MCQIGKDLRVYRRKSVIAYRAYTLSYFSLGTVYLCPLHQRKYDKLSSKHVVAHCMPTRRGSVGLWAYKTANARNARYGTEDVLATVRCSGAIIEHEKGFRAERMEIISLTVNAWSAAKAPVLRARYGVPVRVRK